MIHDYPAKGADRPDPMAYGRTLPAGLGVNLLVRDVDAAARFQTEVLGAKVLYWEEHFAIMGAFGSNWFLHSDHSYRDNEMSGVIAGAEARGVGVELRLYGADPDACETRARQVDAIVIAGASNKPHGLREAFIADADGYVWVPSAPSTASDG